jgi:hypothetical protein
MRKKIYIYSTNISISRYLCLLRGCHGHDGMVVGYYLQLHVPVQSVPINTKVMSR